MSCASSPRSTPPRRLREPDLDHLPRVVPLVDRGRDVEALVALQAHAARRPSACARAPWRSRSCRRPPRLRGTAAAPSLQREEDRGREPAVGDVVLRGEQVERGVDGRRERGGHAVRHAGRRRGGGSERTRPPSASQERLRASARARRPRAPPSRRSRCARYSGEPCRSLLRPVASTFDRLAPRPAVKRLRERLLHAASRGTPPAPRRSPRRARRRRSARRTRRPARSARPGCGNFTYAALLRHREAHRGDDLVAGRARSRTCP